MTIELKMLGKITADKNTLNRLCGICFDMAEAKTRKAEERFTPVDDMYTVYKAVAKMYNEDAEKIYDALDKLGFYDDVK